MKFNVPFEIAIQFTHLVSTTNANPFRGYNPGELFCSQIWATRGGKSYIEIIAIPPEDSVIEVCHPCGKLEKVELFAKADFPVNLLTEEN